MLTKTDMELVYTRSADGVKGRTLCLALQASSGHRYMHAEEDGIVYIYRVRPSALASERTLARYVGGLLMRTVHDLLSAVAVGLFIVAVVAVLNAFGG